MVTRKKLTGVSLEPRGLLHLYQLSCLHVTLSDAVIGMNGIELVAKALGSEDMIIILPFTCILKFDLAVMEQRPNFESLKVGEGGESLALQVQLDSTLVRIDSFKYL